MVFKFKLKLNSPKNILCFSPYYVSFKKNISHEFGRTLKL
jgi:hypothetical protein